MSNKRSDDLHKENEENLLLYQKNIEKFPDVNKNHHPLVVLSSYDLQEETTLSEERKSIYLRHIHQLINQVNEDSLNKKNAIHVNDSNFPPLNMKSLDEEKMRVLNEMVCEECKGRCCLNGGDKAYLQPETIKRYMSKNPDLSPAQVLHNYKKNIVEETHLKSCINHTKKGCALPREMRSDMCNNFYCSTIKELNTTFANPETIPDGAIVISRAFKMNF